MDCPSSRSHLPNAKAIGVVSGVENPEVRFFPEEKTFPITEEIEKSLLPVTPTEVFRIAATCLAKNCQHYDGHKCSLIGNLVETLNPVTDQLPSCSIRSSCRWWHQEGEKACLRCPQVVTDVYKNSLS